MRHPKRYKAGRFGVGNHVLAWQPKHPSKQPSFRRKPESRKSPVKERTGYQAFWIPAFAGTTVL